MFRKTLYFTSDQQQFFKNNQDLTASEHIRRAVDGYIDKYQSVSASLSKKGGKNGK